MTIDIVGDKFSYFGRTYSLKELREYILIRYPKVAQAHMVRMINGKMTFDWETVYLRSRQSGITTQFICYKLLKP
jgi:hypothetical protein